MKLFQARVKWLEGFTGKNATSVVEAPPIFRDLEKKKEWPIRVPIGKVQTKCRRNELKLRFAQKIFILFFIQRDDIYHTLLY